MFTSYQKSRVICQNLLDFVCAFYFISLFFFFTRNVSKGFTDVHASFILSPKIIPPPLQRPRASDWETGGMRGVIRAASPLECRRRREKGEKSVFMALDSAGDVRCEDTKQHLGF